MENYPRVRVLDDNEADEIWGGIEDITDVLEADDFWDDESESPEGIPAAVVLDPNRKQLSTFGFSAGGVIFAFLKKHMTDAGVLLNENDIIEYEGERYEIVDVCYWYRREESSEYLFHVVKCMKSLL